MKKSRRKRVLRDMFGNSRLWLLLLLAITLLTVAGVVAVEPEEASKYSQDQVQLIEFYDADPVISRVDGQVSEVTGAYVAVYNADFQADAGTPEANARQYLTSAANTLGLAHADLSDLQLKAIRTGLTGDVVRFQQYYEGVPVYKGEIAVHVGHDEVISFVSSMYRPNLDLNLQAPILDKRLITEAVHAHIQTSGERFYDVTSPIVYAFHGMSRLAYQVRIEAASPRGSWEILVDAQTGEFFKITDYASYNVAYAENGAASPRGPVTSVDGSGLVFDPDPLTSATALYGDTGFVDGNDATTSQLDGERMAVTLRDIEENGSTYTLRGPWAEVVDHDAPFKGLFSQNSTTFNFDRNDDAFEAVVTYYHIDASMRYLNETLSLNIEPYQYPDGVQYDPSGWGGADNSSYSPGSGRLSFGEGGVDDAEDSDVIHHELGHGLHDWVTNGSLSQVNGLSEGVGDYWAQSYNRSIESWTPADPQYNWVFRWDGHNPFWGGRVTNYGATYPGGLTGSIHTDGQIWATCMMKVWDAVGKTTADTAFWEGLGMTTSGTNQEQAANAVLQAAIDLGVSQSDLEAMRSEFASCGYTMMSILPIEPAAYLPAVVREE